jgi:putative transposase
VDFCIEAVEEALVRHGRPEIFNTDQGSQFTSTAFTGLLLDNTIAISMDGRGAWRDNVFVERLWRSVKYEEVYLRAYDSVGEARASLGRYLDFYNGVRPHQALGYRTPRETFEAAPTCGYVDNASALTTSPQAPQQQQKDSINSQNVLSSFAAPIARVGEFATGGSLS